MTELVSSDPRQSKPFKRGKLKVFFSTREFLSKINRIHSRAERRIVDFAINGAKALLAPKAAALRCGTADFTWSTATTTVEFGGKAMIEFESGSEAASER